LQVEVEGAVFTKEASIIEQKAYRDTWGRGNDSYLQWFFETALMLYELLSENGSIYVHLDSHIGQYAKVILDEIFGVESFRNELIWQRTSSHADSKKWGTVHDVIFYYSKGENPTWNPIYTEHDPQYVKNFYRHQDERGVYRLDHVIRSATMGARPNLAYEYKGYTPEWGWRVNRKKLEKLDADNRLEWSSSGRPYLKRYLHEQKGTPITSVITDIKPVGARALERVGYPTQKPETLIERIIEASSNENDLVLDCFCGSGTTAAVAENLNRRWITCDLGRFAIHTTRKRLLSIENVKPFVVQNLGKYERQAWQAAEFGDPQRAAAVVTQYRKFILDLYRAQFVDGYVWLHGIKDGRMVHVGPVDSPISPSDVTQIAIEFRKAVGTGKDAPKVAAVDVLGWDFAFELNEVAKQQAQQANITMRFIRIPREVLEKAAVEQGDIKFFELAALSVDKTISKRTVTLKLADFVIPPDDVPHDVQKAISHWSQWIDYWAVDWDNKGDTFHNMWQTYRTRQDKSLQLQVAHPYDQPGEYTIMIKVIDILGNDTTKTLQVSIR
jgi:DNA modification methylase